MPVDAPPVRYAPSSAGRVAWQEVGDGPVTFVVIPPLVQHVEMLWEQPVFWRAINRISRRARYVQYDKLGTGLSEPRDTPASLDDRLDELDAVLGAAGVERAWLLGLSEGGTIAIAAAHHLGDRVAGLVLVSTSSGVGGFRRASEFGPMPTSADFRAFFADVGVLWGTPDTLTLSHFAPTLRSIPGMKQWVPAYERAGASRTQMGPIVRSSLFLDADPYVELIRQPTLVLHARGDLVLPVACGRMLGARIPGARYVECEGRDHYAWASPTIDDQLDEIFSFAGLPASGSPASGQGDLTTALTGTERRVVRLVQLGMRDDDVARSLGLSSRAFEDHLARGCAKLGVRSRAELAALDDRS